MFDRLKDRLGYLLRRTGQPKRGYLWHRDR